MELVYVTYHVDVGETPFFIGIDYDMSKIVISIRGTLSMKVCDAQHQGNLFLSFSVILCFLRSQLYLSRQLAQLHPELTMPMFRYIVHENILIFIHL